MPDVSKQHVWTSEEVRREEDAQRARPRRDGGRGVWENLKDAAAHTEFAKSSVRPAAHSGELGPPSVTGS